MRVIAGDFRGRNLKALKGDNTRPTTDRVKESLMSSLYSLCGGFEGLKVLDAFAGSGQLGIEALSRGADEAWFCEKSRDAARVVESNFALCKLDSRRAHLVQSDTFKFSSMLACPPSTLFSSILLTPSTQRMCSPGSTTWTRRVCSPLKCSSAMNMRNVTMPK